MRLPDVCAISTGYTARGRLEPTSIGGLRAIQLGGVDVRGRVRPAHLTRVRLEDVADRYFVSAGDVLFRSRGERNIAFALGTEFQEPALAVLPLMILRPNCKIVTPEYLAWIINQAAAQCHFDRAARGTNMRMVPRSSLDDLEVDIPDIESQRRIVAVDSLAERECELSLLAAETRRKLTSLSLAECASRRTEITIKEGLSQ